MQNFRYVLLLLSTLSMTFIYCNRIVFGFTVICQQPENGTRPDYYLSDNANVAWMFTATAIGMCFGPIPLYWAYKLNTRITIFIYGIISTLGVLLYPLADSIGLWAALICRFTGGFAQASQLHFSNDLVLRWSPKSESSLFFSILLASSQFGPLFTMVLGGEMCSSSFGWEATYYVLALLTFLSSAAYAYAYTDDVEENRFCSDEEQKIINEGKVEAPKKKEPVPYRLVVSHLGIWSCFVLFAGYYVGMIIYQQYSPMFVKQALNFTIRQAGYFCGIPMIFAIVIKIVLGRLIDHGLGLNGKWRLAAPLIFLESISAVSIFLVGFFEDRVLALIFDMVFAIFHFFVPVICSRTIQLIGQQHAHFALNLNMFIAGLIQILLPGGVHMMVPDNTREQWSVLFYIVSAMTVATTILYVIGTDAEPAYWTKSANKVAPTDLESSEHSEKEKAQM